MNIGNKARKHAAERWKREREGIGTNRIIWWRTKMRSF
jgi:post-segregation antitoxin (ccd killing protein)